MAWSHRSPRARATAAALLTGAVTALLASPAASAGAGAAANDPVYAAGLQWSLDRIGAPGAWGRGTGRGITIAVVDSGIDLAHEDLVDKVVGHTSCIGAAGDSGSCTGSAQDDNGHGTHVAGIALAATDNERGVAGVAPDARLLAVRVLANDCSAGGCTATGTAGDVAAGIRWAADHGAHVINLSLGGGAVQATLGCSFCDAVEYAWAKGSIPVIAAGNDSVLPAGFDDEHALVVTATDRDDRRASYSSSNSGLLREARWPIAAPGGEGETDDRDCAPGGTPKGILSTYWITGQRNAYACLAGTSMAAPHVSGALAILRGMGMSPQQAVDRVLATAVDLGPPGRDTSFGVGRVDLARAASAEQVTTTSTTATTAPAPPGTVDVEERPAATTAPGPATSTTEAPAGTPAKPTLPGTEQAAPFGSPGGTDEGPPGWLIAVAVAALLTSGGLTARVAGRQAT